MRGLSENSRTIRELTGQKLSLEQILLARAVDELAFISWSKTKDGQKNRNRPESILNKLLHPEQDTEINGYASGDDFMQAWLDITQKG